MFRWAMVCQEVRGKGKKKSWEERRGAMDSGGERAAPSSAMGTEPATGKDGDSGVAPSGGGTPGRIAVVVGDVGGSGGETEAGGGGGKVNSGEDATGSGEGASGSGGGATDTPPTPTVEELLAATERAGGEWRADASGEERTAGQVIPTPVLRATGVEPRSGDSGIGALHPIPFMAGDFLDTAGPRNRGGAEGCWDSRGSDLGAFVRSFAERCGGKSVGDGGTGGGGDGGRGAGVGGGS